MLARMIITLTVQIGSLGLCFYSEQVWTVAPWSVLLTLSYLWIIRSAYREGKSGRRDRSHLRLVPLPDASVNQNEGG